MSSQQILIAIYALVKKKGEKKGREKWRASWYIAICSVRGEILQEEQLCIMSPKLIHHNQELTDINTGSTSMHEHGQNRPRQEKKKKRRSPNKTPLCPHCRSYCDTNLYQNVQEGGSQVIPLFPRLCPFWTPILHLFFIGDSGSRSRPKPQPPVWGLSPSSAHERL